MALVEIEVSDEVSEWLDRLVQSGQHATREDAMRHALGYLARAKLYFRMRRTLRTVIGQILTDEEALQLMLNRSDEDALVDLVDMVTTSFGPEEDPKPEPDADIDGDEGDDTDEGASSD